MSAFQNLGDLIRRDLDLNKVAIVDLGGEKIPREFTYAQLDAMAMGVARALIARGLKRGDRIAVMSTNRTEYLAAYYGIMRAGFVAVPLNYRFPRKTIHFILADSGAKLVFCDAKRRADCSDIPVVVFGGEGKESYDDFLDPGELKPWCRQDEPAMFLYTSGSTGTLRCRAPTKATSGGGDAA